METITVLGIGFTVVFGIPWVVGSILWFFFSEEEYKVYNAWGIGFITVAGILIALTVCYAVGSLVMHDLGWRG